MSSGNYIVVFKKDASPDEIKKYADEVVANGGKLNREFGLLKGFAAQITPEFLSQLQSLQGTVIDYIEPDQEVTIQQ